MAEDRTRRIALTLASLAAIAVAAPPLGWALGQWVVLGDRGFWNELAQHWVVVPNSATLGLAILAMTKMPRGPARIVLSLVILALLALGAWQGVSMRVEAHGDGIMDASL